jgi:chromosome segregation ATPase
MSAELEKDRQAIEIEKAAAARMKQQLDLAAQALDAEKSAVAAQEAEVVAMRAAVDATKRKTSTADEYEARRYNRKVVDYNTHASEAIAKREHLNASIERYNELVKQHQAQAEKVNQLAAAYNAKLVRYGH